jgi:hypothetical protein
MLTAQLIFLTPLAGFVALAAAVPLTAFAVSAARNARGRAVLDLAPPPPDRTALALATIALLLGLAAAQPAWRSDTGRRIRTDAQAIFVFDTSRSMGASASRHAPRRLAQAQAAAIRLRGAIPEVPSGVASLTTQLLPHLFPTANEAVFDSTVEKVIGVEQPPPPASQYGSSGTSFGALQYLRNQGFFTPSSTKRLVVLLTDGESGPYDPEATASPLVGPTSSTSFGGSSTKAEPPISLVIVRFGHPSDRIYAGDGSVEAEYRPDPQAAAIVSALATAARGRAYPAAKIGGAARGIRELIGSGKEKTRGLRTRTTDLARYVAAAAAAAMAIVLWKRNLAGAWSVQNLSRSDRSGTLKVG